MTKGVFGREREALRNISPKHPLSPDSYKLYLYNYPLQDRSLFFFFVHVRFIIPGNTLCDFK